MKKFISRLMRLTMPIAGVLILGCGSSSSSAANTSTQCLDTTCEPTFKGVILTDPQNVTGLTPSSTPIFADVVSQKTTSYGVAGLLASQDSSGNPIGVLELQSTEIIDGPIGFINFRNNYLPNTGEQRIAAISGSTFGAANSGHMRFYTMNSGTLTAAMKIESTGNINIGNVDNHTATALVNLWGATNPLLYLKATGTASSVIAIDNSSASSSASLDFYNNGTKEWSLYNPGGSTDLRLASGGVDMVTFHNDGSMVLSNLTGGGSVVATSSGMLTLSASDARLKTNIEPITKTLNVLDTLPKLTGIYFNWNPKEAQKRGIQREIGFTAQNVQEVIPEAVGTNKDGYLTLDYNKLVPYLVEVTKALKTKVDTLEQEIKTLKQKECKGN